MRPSPLLTSVLQAHGFARVPSSDDVQNMSLPEKQALYEKQKRIVIQYREESQRQVEALRAKIDSAISMALDLGVPLGDPGQPLTRSNSDNALPEPPQSPAPTSTPLAPPRTRWILKPALGGKRGRGAENRCSYDFTFADRRLTQIDREISCITKRFKEFKVGAFYCKRPYYGDRH